MASSRVHRRYRRSWAVTLVLVLVAVLAPAAGMSSPRATLAAEPARTVELDVSWTRPGVVGTLAPPTALRVGDEVTVTTTRIGFESFSSALCYLAFRRDVQDGKPMLGATLEDYHAPVCQPWTFIVPPSDPGDFLVGVTTLGAEAERFDVTVELTLEAGGSPRTVTSNVPLITWDLATLVGSERVRFGEPWTIPAPADAEHRCEYQITGSYLAGMVVYERDETCQDWTVTLPDIRPAALRSSEPNGYPWQVFLHGSWQREDEATREAGRLETGELLVDDAVGPVTFSSNLPAAVFAADDNPYYAYAGPITRTPLLASVTDGTCRWELVRPSGSIEQMGTFPLDDGTCAPLTFAMTGPGVFQVHLQIFDADGDLLAGASSGGVIIDPLPEPDIDVPPVVDAGEPVEIDASTPSGTPLEYEITPVLESATTASGEGSTVVLAATAECDGASGTFLLEDADRAATATCTFPSAGSYRITATFRDPLGTEREATTVIQVRSDTVAPTISALRQRLVPGSQLGTSAIPVQIAWSASDAGSGVSHVEVARQTDGGPWVVVAGQLVAASITRDQYRGHRYRFRVRAVDGAGNRSPWAYTATFGPTAYSETNVKLRYSGTWSTTSSVAAYGGAMRSTTRPGAAASITFTGRSVAWVAPVSPLRGWAKVYLDGKLTRRVDLHAASLTQRRLVFAWNWTTRGTHTLRIVNEATGGHPRMDLDAVVVLD